MTVSPEVGITMLEFDEAEHRYFVDGSELPSVTTILRRAGLVDFSYCTEYARERGSAAHRAIHFEMQDDLDWSRLSHTLAPYVTAARQCVTDLQCEIVAVERRVWHPTYRYAGTLDILVRQGGRLTLIDWKTGDPPPATALQLAGYAEAYEVESGGEKIRLRYACRLFPDGKYALTPYTDRQDFRVFAAAITTAAWRLRHGLETA